MKALGSPLGRLACLEDIESRSICPENPTGEKGRGAMAEIGEGVASYAARDLGKGWKVNPYLIIQPGQTTVLAEIKGPGEINHIWMTATGKWRNLIFRIYWDDANSPGVECPLGDFFCSGWQCYSPLSSAAVCVNPGSAFNCYWPMPFRRRCFMTIENRGNEASTLFYQIDYCLHEVPDNMAYFFAQFRRVNPLPYKEIYTILDNIQGDGTYVGTYMAWGVNNNGWWGEGEIKFYIDGDEQYPTICGTGTEDYFCGSYNFENQSTKQYKTFTTQYAGLNQVLKPDGLYASQMRFSMYRWHIPDPIRFKKDLRVTIQALGWRSEGRYLPMQDDISSVAFWYQKNPETTFPILPDKDYLEII